MLAFGLRRKGKKKLTAQLHNAKADLQRLDFLFFSFVLVQLFVNRSGHCGEGVAAVPMPESIDALQIKDALFRLAGSFHCLHDFGSVELSEARRQKEKTNSYSDDGAGTGIRTKRQIDPANLQAENIVHEGLVSPGVMEHGRNVEVAVQQ